MITQLEPGLFKKVTGLTVKDFELLVSLGVFNDALMNDAVYKFRRYEDSSLTYAGVNRHEGERVGLFDTTLSDFEYMEMAQQESMVEPNGLSKASATEQARTTDEHTTSPVATKPTDKANPTLSKGGAPSASFTPMGEGDARRDWLDDELDDAGLEYLDRREGDGCLWVIDSAAASALVKKLNERGAGFKLSSHGGRATGGRAAWWLKGYPEESFEPVKPTPIVTKAELNGLDLGDTVFHKAFGYGQIVSLDDSYIEVSFENDNHKKKPSRRFVFPGSFYQGLLRIG